MMTEIEVEMKIFDEYQEKNIVEKSMVLLMKSIRYLWIYSNRSK